MIVEVFQWGTGFGEYLGKIWGVKSVVLDSGKYILAFRDDRPNEVIDADSYELRIS